MRKVVFAVHAHPDDIEFVMAGTLLLLREHGWELHYMTLSDGNCGSVEMSGRESASIRAAEARSASSFLGATFHESITHDMEVFYNKELLTRVASVIRLVSPSVVLVPSPEDYMEDHTNTCRIAVSAAFARGMPNFETDPATPPVEQDVAVYHSMPHGLRDALDRPVMPDFLVDITSVIDEKERALAMHESQKDWLDRSQGFDSYLKAMRDMSSEAGALASSPTAYAEGWRRHSHLGFSATRRDPLSDELGDLIRATG